ncbi:hypothetical protein RIB2604_03101210 [Aspergillus luchuensis]|uniref:Uncharacterized protein n=1 Tax=Aspergillus kawachii TaxID=1069201 RepID=A0A146FWQ1_ASPKA|nr:hypothetical protein RIB2604_03101210 [Aspergillus luchuensis]
MPQRSKRQKTGEEEQAEQEDDAPRKTRRFGEQQPSSDRIGGRSGGKWATDGTQCDPESEVRGLSHVLVHNCADNQM